MKCTVSRLVVRLNKCRYLDEWVLAVNEQGGFGYWRCDVAGDGGTLGPSVRQTAYRLG
jgi:hypothetical protein